MKRARNVFWTLVAVATVATGVLSQALSAKPSPAAGAAVSVSSVVLAVAVGLAARILIKVGVPRN